MGELDGKVAVITGAGSGMGRASARVFVREGAQVLAADISGSGAPRPDKYVSAPLMNRTKKGSLNTRAVGSQITAAMIGGCRLSPGRSPRRR